MARMFLADATMVGLLRIHTVCIFTFPGIVPHLVCTMRSMLARMLTGECEYVVLDADVEFLGPGGRGIWIGSLLLTA